MKMFRIGVFIALMLILLLNVNTTMASGQENNITPGAVSSLDKNTIQSLSSHEMSKIRGEKIFPGPDMIDPQSWLTKWLNENILNPHRISYNTNDTMEIIIWEFSPNPPKDLQTPYFYDRVFLKRYVFKKDVFHLPPGSI